MNYSDTTFGKIV